MTEDTIGDVKLGILKKAFSRVTKKREESVITKLVYDYRNDLLTKDKAYAAIIVIAELRNAESDLSKLDL